MAFTPLLLDGLFDKSNGRKGGRPTMGRAVCTFPSDQSMKFDITTQVGGCTGLYYAITFQLPKWGYNMKKIDEWMDVSPLHSEAYNLTIEQKHKIESQIKEGLRSAAQAVADYELLKHDYRKYKDILDFWKKGLKDDHVLRSLFIDRVDAHTGEGYSMISMARRWPTIISDFIRMSRMTTEKENVDEIKKFLSVTVAEANVLKTKNDLYEQWKTAFFPEIRERYARIKNMTQAREKSVNEYKEWLKPYIARYNMMNEATQKEPKKYLTNVFFAPGFGTSWAETGIRFLAWDSFFSPEFVKMERVEASEKEGEGGGIKPYDKWVEAWLKKKEGDDKWPWLEEEYGVKSGIEEYYQVKFDKDRIEKILKAAYKPDIASGISLMGKSALYYRVFNFDIYKAIVKTPKGGELENIVITLEHFLASQNVILTLILELEAREEQFERNIKKMIGSSELEKEELEGWNKNTAKEMVAMGMSKEDIAKKLGISEEDVSKYVDVKEKKFKGFRKVGGKFKAGGRTIGGWFSPMSEHFFRGGPYENTFKERITKRYMIPMGSGYFNPLVQFIKWKAGVPWAKQQY